MKIEASLLQLLVRSLFFLFGKRYNVCDVMSRHLIENEDDQKIGFLSNIKVKRK